MDLLGQSPKVAICSIFFLAFSPLLLLSHYHTTLLNTDALQLLESGVTQAPPITILLFEAIKAIIISATFKERYAHRVVSRIAMVKGYQRHGNGQTPKSFIRAATVCLCTYYGF